MFYFNDLRQIHLEITNNCQASCPMCSRNHHGGMDNPLLTINNWTLEQFKNTINLEVLRTINSIFFCGNFGDPLLNNDLLEMCRYVTSKVPDIEIRIHTNGSIKNTEWWANLAKVLPKRHSVIFGIDGLKDTNHIYRAGTSFKKIMDNAAAFINAGGFADWTYIVFKHNEHQVEEAQALAKEMRFGLFTRKNSSRFLLDESFPVYDKEGNTVSTLQPSTESKIVFVDRKIIQNYKQVIADSEIDCYAIKNKEIYIDAFGKLFPCCFLASTPYNYTEPTSELLHVKQDMLRQYNNLIADLGGEDAIDTRKHSIRSIINSYEYQTVWDKHWTEDKLITCGRTCGTNKMSKPIDQFIERSTLND